MGTTNCDGKTVLGVAFRTSSRSSPGARSPAAALHALRFLHRLLQLRRSSVLGVLGECSSLFKHRQSQFARVSQPKIPPVSTARVTAETFLHRGQRGYTRVKRPR